MPAPKGQARPGRATGAGQDDGLTEDGQDLGIAEDAAKFEGLVEESTDKARTLESDWLYQVNGQVFGPVKPRDLLELLYAGEIDKDTPIALDGTDFAALHRYGVFRVHLPKAERVLRERAAAAEAEAEATRQRLQRRLKVGLSALLVAVVLTIGLVQLIRYRKQADAEAEAHAKEAALLKEIDNLMSRVTIEPPLVALVTETEEPKGSDPGQKKKRGRAVARFTGGASGTGELSHGEIMSGIATAFPGFKRCIVEQIQRDSDSVPEQIVLSFSINNDGVAQEITLTDHALRRTPLAGCMAGKLSQVRFRPYKGEVQNVEYPITIGRR